MKTSSTRRPLHQQTNEKAPAAFFTKKDPDAAFFQAKSAESSGYSALEKEADQVASTVTQSLYSPSLSATQTGVQKKAEDEKKEDVPAQQKGEDEKKEEQAVQKKEDKPVNTQARFDGLLKKTKGGGSVLPAKVRSLLEQRMNANFEHVRIHSDQDAIELCGLSNAQAFTHGTDIYFNVNKFNPETEEGLNLLAHELTHIIQQNGPMK